jgi:hypothetical protein
MIETRGDGGPSPNCFYVVVLQDFFPDKSGEMAFSEEVVDCLYASVAKVAYIWACPTFFFKIIPGGDFFSAES